MNKLSAERRARHPERVEPAAVPVHRSEDLLKMTRQAEILHRGQRYVLRETRAGKLILNK